MRRLSALILAGSLAFVLAACGGGSSKSSSSSKSSEASSDSGNSSGSAGNSNDNAYAKLVEKGNNAKVKVTYRNADGSTYVIAQDPPKRAFISGETAVYEDGTDVSIVCSNVGTPEVSCLKISGAGGLAGFAGAGSLGLISEILQTKDLPGVTKIGERTIAGRTATCATYSVPFFGSGKIEGCVDKDTGISLLLKTSGGGSSNIELEATKVESPSAKDFTPPAEPTDLNSLIPTTTTN